VESQPDSQKPAQSQTGLDDSRPDLDDADHDRQPSIANQRRWPQYLPDATRTSDNELFGPAKDSPAIEVSLAGESWRVILASKGVPCELPSYSSVCVVNRCMVIFRRSSTLNEPSILCIQAPHGCFRIYKALQALYEARLYPCGGILQILFHCP